MQLEFSGEVWFWKGPAPFFFITVPDDECGPLEAASPMVSYGWGMIPVTAHIGATTWTTALFPKDGQYVVPLKQAIRNAESVNEGDLITVRLDVDV